MECNVIPETRGNSGFGNFEAHSRNNAVFRHAQKITELLYYVSREENYTVTVCAYPCWYFLQWGQRIVRPQGVRSRICHIGRVIVHPEFQHRGLGTRLMNRIEHHVRAARRDELFTGERSERNLYLYHKLGYRIFRTERLTGKTTIVFLEKAGQAIEDRSA